MSSHLNAAWTGRSAGSIGPPPSSFSRGGPLGGGDDMDLDATLHRIRSAIRTREGNENLDRTCHLRIVKKQRLPSGRPGDVPRFRESAKFTWMAEGAARAAGADRAAGAYRCPSPASASELWVQQEIVVTEQAAATSNLGALLSTPMDRASAGLAPKRTTSPFAAGGKPPGAEPTMLMLWVCDRCGKTELDLSSSSYKCFKCDHEEKSLLYIDTLSLA